jgi:hypothetical protein
MQAESSGEFGNIRANRLKDANKKLVDQLKEEVARQDNVRRVAETQKMAMVEEFRKELQRINQHFQKQFVRLDCFTFVQQLRSPIE